MGEDKLQFYKITDSYLSYLRTIEPKIHSNYPNRVKPHIGVIINIGIHQYFAPLSSYKPEKYDRIKTWNKTIFKIYGSNPNEKISVIHLNNMFPIIPTEIERIDFSLEERKYRVLLEKEYRFIVANQEAIRQRAHELYQDVLKGNTFYSKISNNFNLLENEYRNYSLQNTSAS
ncbi:type III toxin-antitoxin system ToxN/AbiQ family toxin [Paenibacillus sp. Dod16]|uniref:type III toxin-antitoxin system ToxN/AbiQ family toxin n=1 Tax=Paenibacillus sp. Dod16 TaxID=3416392 RepID=UPI003CF37166